MSFRRSISAFTLLLACAHAQAAQPLLTDDTGTQGRSGNQFEFAANEDKEKSSGTTTTKRTLPLVYTRGLGDTVDIFAQANHVAVSVSPPPASASGGGNPSFGLKWRFYDNEDSKTSLGIKPEIRLPVTRGGERDDLGHGRTSYTLTGILTQEVFFGAIHANIVTSRDNFRDTATNPNESTTRISVAPVWDVADQWKLALDVGTANSRAGGVSTRSGFVELGTIFSPNKNLDFALGFIRTRDNANPRTTTTSATAGVTWRFK